jgi:hypothetical protein
MNAFEIAGIEKIGHFFLKRNNNDYQETEKYLFSMRITGILVFPDEIIVTLRRPGLLIGKRGELITALREYMGKEIRIVEDVSPDIYLHLVPMYYSDYSDFEEPY